MNDNVALDEDEVYDEDDEVSDEKVDDDYALPGYLGCSPTAQPGRGALWWKVCHGPRQSIPTVTTRALEAASNIVFTNGLLDPWSSGGVLKPVGGTASLIIPEVACLDHLDPHYSASTREPITWT